MTASDLLSLAERVERASGADAALFDAVAAAVLVPYSQEHYRFAQLVGCEAWLEAAMALLSPGSEFDLTNLYGVARAHVDMNDQYGGHHGEHLGGDIALAVVSAAVKARAAMMGEGKDG